MIHLELNNIYYTSNSDVIEYKDIFLDTNLGVLLLSVTSLDVTTANDLQAKNRLDEVDRMKEKYDKLYIQEVRRTYDNDMYFLIAGKFILVIEYLLNSNFNYSTQEFRIIENIHTANKAEFDSFKEMDIIELPSFTV